MSYGYSHRLIRLNKQASGRLLGVRLGRACIKHDLSVEKAAEKLGVSRQTVYNWFCGVHSPHDSQVKAVEALLRNLNSGK